MEIIVRARARNRQPGKACHFSEMKYTMPWKAAWLPSNDHPALSKIAALAKSL